MEPQCYGQTKFMGLLSRTRSWPFVVIVLLLGCCPPCFSQTTASKTKSAVVLDAEKMIKEKKYKEATTLLWKNIESLSRREIILLIRCHEQLEEWTEVKRAATLITGKNPNDSEALMYLGLAKYKKASLAEAKEDLAKSIELDPKRRRSYQILIEIYKDNSYERRLLYQDMLKQFGQTEEILSALCELNTKDGANDQADKTCLLAIQKDPKNPNNHVYLALIQKNKQELENAQKGLEAAAKKFPKSEFAQTEFAILTEESKNYVDAFNHYNLCLDINKLSERCLLGVGETGVQIQKYEKSIQAFRDLCRKYGRKHTSSVRRASYVLKGRGVADWMSKYSSLADGCASL